MFHCHFMRRLRVCAALRAAEDRLSAPLVAAAFLAAADRSEDFRREAAFVAWRERASCDAVSRGSFFSTLDTAREHARPSLRLALVLACLVSVFGTFARAFLDSAFFRWRQIDAGTSCLREANRNGLLRRSRAMLAAPDFVYLLADEFPCLGCRRFAFALGLPCLLYCLLLRHLWSPMRFIFRSLALLACALE
jgi:hypothetical protein